MATTNKYHYRHHSRHIIISTTSTAFSFAISIFFVALIGVLLRPVVIVAASERNTNNHPLHPNESTITTATATDNSNVESAIVRPTSIIEAEARTARELRVLLTKSQQELQSCTTRNEALSDGFQDLYKSHLSNIESLRKCKEGMVVPSTTTINNEKQDDASRNNNNSNNNVLTEQKNIILGNDYDDDETKKNQQKYLALVSNLEALIQRETTWERTISELVARRDLLESREGAWERTIFDLMGELEIRSKRERWWMDTKKEMEGRIQALSHMAVLERYGPGPHYISIRVALDERNPSSVREIIVQLAPLDLMPHSIHLFLTQISEGYWNVGTPAFVLNAPHVLQACPHPCLESMEFGGDQNRQQTDLYEEMKHAGFDTVLFQEYSTLFPHKKYTIGFAGRPHSGPEFYINLMDNTLDHGTLDERKNQMGSSKFATWAKEALWPNGSTLDVGEKNMLIDVNTMVANEPYPCFGMVIDGFEIVDEIAKGMTRKTMPRSENDEVEGYLDSNMLIRPVHITSLSVLKDYKRADGRTDTRIEL